MVPEERQIIFWNIEKDFILNSLKTKILGNFIKTSNFEYFGSKHSEKFIGFYNDINAYIYNFYVCILYILMQVGKLKYLVHIFLMLSRYLYKTFLIQEATVSKIKQK